MVLLITILLSSLQVVGPQTGERQSNPSFGLISGTEIPERYRSEKHECYVYERYVVFEVRLENTSGKSIRVIRRSKDGGTRCDMDEGKEVLFIDGENKANHFDGLYKNYLFVDSGTGPGFRGLTVYNLLTGAPIYKAMISMRAILSYPSLTFHKMTDKTVPCPEANGWKIKYDFGFAFDEKVILDLNTLHEEYSGDIQCIPQQ